MPTKSTAADAKKRAKPKLRDEVNKFKQELILEKAIDLFYENGYTRTTMAQIADELGVTKPFLYQRYQSKEDILEDVFSRAEAMSVIAAEAILSTSEPPDAKLRTLVTSVVDTALNNYRLTAVYYTEERNLSPSKTARPVSLRQQWENVLTKILEEGRRKKLFKFGDISCTVNVMLGGILWSAHWYPEFMDKSRDWIVNEVSDAVMAVVGYRSRQ